MYFSDMEKYGKIPLTVYAGYVKILCVKVSSCKRNVRQHGKNSPGVASVDFSETRLLAFTRRKSLFFIFRQ